MKKHNQDVSTTPSWIVRLDDDEDEEDPEFYGAPAFESKLVPEGYKETTRHNHIIQEQYVVSVKEYLMHKLEPKEDVLSPVISKVMSPKRAPGDMGVGVQQQSATQQQKNQETAAATATARSENKNFSLQRAAAPDLSRQHQGSSTAVSDSATEKPRDGGGGGDGDGEIGK
ncbi:hypothetical protein SO802_022346 [Lithocarpus litseifolius]|uniref:LTI65/LTI78 PGEED repeat domain-containing protein n=1 Tax=Lithocarpus litseifolius TaxID=425828 RepID=A0AAW2CKT3_9ROSI